MKMISRFFGIIIICLVLSVPSMVAAQGKIVVNHDEWTLAQNTSTTKTFIENIASWFTNGESGNFLGYSNNFGVANSVLGSTLVNAGHNWTQSLSVPFTLESLLNYDGVFLMGNYVNNSVLIDYVNAGGNVYVAGGTGWGGSYYEAAAWNNFLQAFGLYFDNYYNYNITGGCKTYYFSSSHPVLEGVSNLYYCNGNTVRLVDSTNESASIIHQVYSEGLIAVYESCLDSDEDEVCDEEDNCLNIYNPEQANSDDDYFGDACDICIFDSENDSDADSVCGDVDSCPDTESGAIIDETGCSIDQLCPCDNEWKNHGKYVSCVAHTVQDFVEQELISENEKGAIISEAGQSSCGHKKNKK